MTLRLKDVTAGYSQYKISANFQAIQDFINEKALHRGATQGEANEMRTNLILSPTTFGGGTGSGEGVIGAGGDLCDLPIFPPVEEATEGVRLSQSVLEILHKPPSDLRVSQSVVEYIHKPVSVGRLSQSILEVLHTGV